MTKEKTLALMTEHAELDEVIRKSNQLIEISMAKQKEIVALLSGGTVPKATESAARPPRSPRTHKPTAGNGTPFFKRRGGIIGVPEKVWTYLTDPALNPAIAHTSGQVASALEGCPENQVALALSKLKRNGFLTHTQEGYLVKPCGNESPTTTETPPVDVQS